MKTLITSAAALLSLSLTAPAFALPSSTTTSVAPVTAPNGAQLEKRAQMHEKMGAFVAQQLSTKIGLDAAKSAKLADAVKAFQARKQSQRKTVHEEMQKLQQLVDNKAPDAQLKQQLDVVANVRDERSEKEAFLADTAKFLTLQEQAKLALALPKVMREAHHEMKREWRQNR